MSVWTGSDVLSYEYVGYSLSKQEGHTPSEATPGDFGRASLVGWLYIGCVQLLPVFHGNQYCIFKLINPILTKFPWTLLETSLNTRTQPGRLHSQHRCGMVLLDREGKDSSPPDRWDPRICVLLA